jgi:hypothetical protein
MPSGAETARQLAELSQRLKDMGTEGRGLRRELYKAMNDSVDPFRQEISSTEHLDPYMPNRYAGVLAGDMSVRTAKRSGDRVSVSIVVEGRRRRRQVQRINQGVLRHPVFGRSTIPRQDWTWRDQAAAMRPGFFDNAVNAAAPAIRDRMAAAMDAVAKKITG